MKVTRNGITLNIENWQLSIFEKSGWTIVQNEISSPVETEQEIVSKEFELPEIEIPEEKVAEKPKRKRKKKEPELSTLNPDGEIDDIDASTIGVTGVKLADLTREELILQASALGIRFSGNPTKQRLITAIKAKME